MSEKTYKDGLLEAIRIIEEYKKFIETDPNGDWKRERGLATFALIVAMKNIKREIERDDQD